MTTEQIKSIKIGTVLNWIPTGEHFVVTGFNEYKIKSGTETSVIGIDCDSNGKYFNESMPSVYNLSKSQFPF
jgi:aspartate carbamoyltransferase regulatory subunit